VTENDAPLARLGGERWREATGEGSFCHFDGQGGVFEKLWTLNFGLRVHKLPPCSFYCHRRGGVFAGFNPNRLSGRPRQGIDIRTVAAATSARPMPFAFSANRRHLRACGGRLKGFAACSWLADFVIQLFAVAPDENMRIVAGISAVLGHNFTCWLKFKAARASPPVRGLFCAGAAGRGISLARGWLCSC